VIIIGILAAIVIPTFLLQRQKAQDAAAKSDTRNAATAETLYYAENDTFTTTVDPDLVDQGFRQSDRVTTTAPTADATIYCVQSESASGNIFHMEESGGGVQDDGCQ
jgi:type II secretory pathway pseudopilin PulG